MDFNLEMYIRSDAFILVPVLYVIGLLLRQTPYIPKWSHVWIKLLFAVIACLSLLWSRNTVCCSRYTCYGSGNDIRGLIHNTIY